MTTTTVNYCTCGHVQTHHQRAAVWLPIQVCTWKGCDCVDFVDSDKTWRVRQHASS